MTVVRSFDSRFACYEPLIIKMITVQNIWHIIILNRCTTHEPRLEPETNVNYSGIFYSCQFIKSFRPFHSFWEDDDLSGRSIQAFQNDTIIISWLFSFRVIKPKVQWHTFKTFMFVFINSSLSQKLFVNYLISI